MIRRRTLLQSSSFQVTEKKKTLMNLSTNVNIKITISQVLKYKNKNVFIFNPKSKLFQRNISTLI